MILILKIQFKIKRIDT